MKPEKTQEEKIVDAAIQCIEEVGLGAATIRKIAQTAGVNSAAINYYFRSKDVLLERVMEQTTENAFGDWERIIVDTTRSPAERLRFILTELLEGSFGYPNLVKAHLHGPVVDGSYETVFPRRFRVFMTTTRDALAPALPGLSAPVVERRLIALFAGAVGLGLLRGLFETLRDAGLDQSEGRAAYVDGLIATFLGGAG